MSSWLYTGMEKFIPQTTEEYLVVMIALEEHIETMESSDSFGGPINTSKEKALLKKYESELLIKEERFYLLGLRDFAKEILPKAREDYLKNLLCSKCPFFGGSCFYPGLIHNIYCFECKRPGFEHRFTVKLSPQWFCHSLTYQMNFGRNNVSQTIDYEKLQEKIYGLIDIQCGEKELKVFKAQEELIKQNIK